MPIIATYVTLAFINANLWMVDERSLHLGEVQTSRFHDPIIHGSASTLPDLATHLVHSIYNWR